LDRVVKWNTLMTVITYHVQKFGDESRVKMFP
jgi:hypothetical protein